MRVGVGFLEESAASIGGLEPTFIFLSCLPEALVFVFQYSRRHILDERVLPTSPSPYVTSQKLIIWYKIVSHLLHFLDQ